MEQSVYKTRDTDGGGLERGAVGQPADGDKRPELGHISPSAASSRAPGSRARPLVRYGSTYIGSTPPLSVSRTLSLQQTPAASSCAQSETHVGLETAVNARARQGATACVLGARGGQPGAYYVRACTEVILNASAC